MNNKNNKNEKAVNAPVQITKDSMVMGYRLGDLIAVKTMVDKQGLDVQAIASAIRYGYNLAIADFEKVIDGINNVPETYTVPGYKVEE